jgi:chemotaxis signal transduction protein
VSAHEAGDSETAETLRRAFDASFACQTIAAPVLEDFLAIRVGEHPFALRLSEIVALLLDKKFVPIASDMPEVLGVATFRGVLAPVFELGPLLGYPHRPAPRWFVLIRSPGPLALAFDQFEAHLRVPRADLISETSEREELRRRHLRGAVRTAETIRPLIHIASVVAAVKRRLPLEGAPKER